MKNQKKSAGALAGAPGGNQVDSSSASLEDHDRAVKMSATVQEHKAWGRRLADGMMEAGELPVIGLRALQATFRDRIADVGVVSGEQRVNVLADVAITAFLERAAELMRAQTDRVVEAVLKPARLQGD